MHRNKQTNKAFSQYCSFLCRPQSAADDDTSSELQRLAEMDAPQQRRGGFRRWVSPLPCYYPLPPVGPVRSCGPLGPRGLSNKSSRKPCQLCPSSIFLSRESSCQQVWRGGGGFSSDLSVAVSGRDCLPSRGAQVEGSEVSSQEL